MLLQYQSPNQNKTYPTTKWARCRQRSGAIVCILLISILLQFADQEQLHAQGGTHIVRYGETLSTIAVRYGVTVQNIARENAIYNVNNIRAGQSLIIPGGAMTAQVVVPQGAGTGQGDRAARANPPVSQPSAPRPPVSQPAAAPIYGCNGVALAGERTYSVRPGDTLYGVGRAFGVSVIAIQQRNSLTSTIIRVGQCLIVPTSSRATPAPDRRRDSERQGVSWPLRVTPREVSTPSKIG